MLSTPLTQCLRPLPKEFPVPTPPASPLGPSGRSTRRSIATAAASLFGEHGYEATSVRAVAAAAGVDPALVIRYFGSKEDLFLETIQLHAIFDAALQAPLPELGAQLVETVLELRGTRALQVHAALVRASGHAKVQQSLRSSTQHGFVEPLTARLEGPDPQLRARLVTAQVLGLLDALALREDDLLLRADATAVITSYGAVLDALIAPA